MFKFEKKNPKKKDTIIKIIFFMYHGKELKIMSSYNLVAAVFKFFRFKLKSLKGRLKNR